MGGKNICCLDGCKNRIQTGLSFFRCPIEHRRCQIWKNALGFTGPHKYSDFTPEQCNNSIRICALHFDEDSFANSSRSCIHNYAVPSLRLTIDSAGKAAIKDETESGDDYGDFEDENISMEYTDPPEMKFTAEEESNTRVTESPNSSIHQPVIDNKPIEMNNVDDFSEIDSFFKGIVETVKKLSPVNQVLLQKQIANLVFDMKLKELQEQE